MRSIASKKTLMSVAVLTTAMAMPGISFGQSTYTWDSSGANPSSSVDGSGNWDLSTADWSKGSSDVVWPNDTSIAAFGNRGTAGTVTVQTPVTAGAMLFNPVSNGSYTIAGSNTITLVGNAAIGVLANANISAPIGGSAGLLFGGSSTLNLSGANTYTGATVLDSGTLQVGSGTALPATTALTVDSGATLDTNNQAPTAASLAGAGTVLLESGSNLTLNQTANSTFSGTLSGSGTLTKLLAGALTISAPSPSFTGTLALTNTNLNQVILSGNANINNSTILVTNNAAASGGPELSLSNLATALTAPITFNPGPGGFRFTINAAAGTNEMISSPITANFTTSAPQLVFNSSAGTGNLAVSSNVTVANTATGTGLVVFRGTSAESFTGKITAPSNIGVTLTDTGGSLYFAPQAGSTWGTTSLAGGYTLEIPYDAALTDGTAISGASNSLSFGGGKLQLVNYSSNLSFVQANMSGTNALNLGAATGAPSTFNGSINLTGTNAVNFIGPGTLLMNGTVTTGGAVSLTGGTLQLGNSNIFPVTSSPTVPSGATLDLNGQFLEVKALSGAGNVMLTGAGSELQLDGSSGTLSGTISGAGQIYEYTGTLTLSGNNTAFSGATTINGTITLGNTNALGTGDVSNYGTLAIAAFSPTLGSLGGYGGTITGSGNLTVGADNNPASYGGAIDTTGSLTVVGTGTFTLGGTTSTYTGATNVNSGTLQLAGGYTNVLPTTTALTIASGATFDMSGNSQQVVSLAGAGSIVNNGQLTIQGSATTTFSGSISGGALIVAEGAANILTLTGSNSLTGGTQVNSGTLAINSDAALGGSSATVTFGGGILKFLNYSSNFSFNNQNVILGAGTGVASTLAGAVTGSGTLTYNGPGTLILTNTGNNYSGGTTVAGGNLQFGAGAFPGGTITINSPGVLDITGAFNTVASALSSITNSSTGAIALTSDSSENIDFTNYSSLSLGAQVDSTYTGAITPGSNGYNFGGGGATLTLPNDNAVTGGNNLNMVASGTVALTGNNSNFTGLITLTSGTLAIASDVAINNAAGGITFNGGTLQFNNYATSLPLSSYTALKLGAASGTASTLNSALTNATSLTYQGPGTLLIGSGVMLPTALALTVNAGTLDLNGQSQTVASLTGAGTVATEAGAILSIGTTNATAAATNSTFSGVITGTGGFAKNNAGTLTLTGTSTLTGQVSINQYSTTAATGITLSGTNASINSASSLAMTNNVSPGNSGFVPTLTLSNLGSAVTLQINVTLSAGNRANIINTAGANTVTSPITYSSTDTTATTLNFYSNAGTLTVSSDITVSGAKPQVTFRGTGTGVEGIFTGTIDGAGVANLIVGKTDPNTWVLDPTVGSTWGANTLAGGTWQMGRANVLPPTVLMPLLQSSTLDLNGFDQTVGGLTSAAGSEFVTSNNGAATLTIAVPTGVSDAFGSATSDAIEGPLTITIAGPGTETFGNSVMANNNKNTYTGGTNLNGGTLIFNNTSTINNLGTGPISFNGGALTYNGTANTYDLTTNGLTINSGGATINIGANTVTFANAISGGGPLTKTGTGSFTLNASVNLSALTLGGGPAHLVSAGNTISGTLTLNGSTSLQIDGNTTVGKLSGDGTGALKITAGKVAATAQGQSTLSLASLSIAPGALLDLDNGNLAINYGTGADPYSTIISEIRNGYDLGTWDGGTPVTGSIISSASIGQATALGYADNTTSHQVQVKYTWYGDLNLDGVVDSTDEGLMSSSGSTWGTGDLNYDGIVNADDWALFMYGNASQNNSISAGVPEPTSAALALLPLAAGCISRRRRR